MADRIRDNLEHDDIELARQAAEELRRREPKNPVSYQLGAIVAEREGDRDQALEIVKEGLAVAPENPNLKEMEKYLTRKVDEASAAPAKARVMDILSRISQAGEEGPSGAGRAAARPRQAPEPGREAALLAQAGPMFSPPPSAGRRPPAPPRGVMGLDPAQEQRSFDRAIAEDPNNATAWRYRALLKRKRGDRVGALEDARRAVKVGPRDDWAHKVLAMIHLDLGQAPEALAAAEAALRIKPADPHAHWLRGRALSRMGKVDEGLQDQRQAALLDPALFDSLYQEALGEARRPGPGGHGPPQGIPPPVWALLGVGATLLGLWATRRGAPTVAPAGALSLPAAMPTPTPLSGFEIAGVIGQGGMGVVYEGFDRALGRRVAIKRMRPEIAADPKEAALFLREARLVAALSHPNIVAIYSVLEGPGELHLVFERVLGESLQELLARRGALPLAEALPLLEQVGRGLDYAHGKGVLHRDLKPANVIVTAQGEAKVADFGIARHEAETLARLTRGIGVGTPAYMAPEQQSGRGERASDIFSLGACAYEILTGETPFPGGALEPKLRRGYTPPSARAAGLAGAEAALARALSPEPSERPATAAELVALLAASAT